VSISTQELYHAIAPLVEFASDETRGIKIVWDRQYVDMGEEDRDYMAQGLPTLYKGGASDMKIDTLDQERLNKMGFAPESIVQAHSACLLFFGELSVLSL
jgi:hypothetical protein